MIVYIAGNRLLLYIAGSQHIILTSRTQYRGTTTRLASSTPKFPPPKRAIQQPFPLIFLSEQVSLHYWTRQDSRSRVGYWEQKA